MVACMGIFHWQQADSDTNRNNRMKGSTYSCLDITVHAQTFTGEKSLSVSLMKILMKCLITVSIVSQCTLYDCNASK